MLSHNCSNVFLCFFRLRWLFVFRVVYFYTFLKINWQKLFDILYQNSQFISFYSIFNLRPQTFRLLLCLIDSLLILPHYFTVCQAFFKTFLKSFFLFFKIFSSLFISLSFSLSRGFPSRLTSKACVYITTLFPFSQLFFLSFRQFFFAFFHLTKYCISFTFHILYIVLALSLYNIYGTHKKNTLASFIKIKVIFQTLEIITNLIF